MENRAKRELARKRFIIHSVLCALVPPLGMLLVWRSRYESKKKLLMTFASTLILTIMFTVGLALQEPEKIEPPALSAGYAYPQNSYTEPVSEPAPEIPQTPETPVETEPQTFEENFVAPANPNG